jgi:hypothetical protein
MYEIVCVGRQNRELSEEERSLGSIGFIAGSLGYLGEAQFEEPSAHYPLWKPAGSFYSRGEAPPPYEEAVAAARAEAALSRNTAGMVIQIYSMVQLCKSVKPFPSYMISLAGPFWFTCDQRTLISAKRCEWNEIEIMSIA